MKKILVLTFALCLTLSLFAKDYSDNTLQRTEQLMTKLIKELKLIPKQSKEIREIYLEQFDYAEAHRPDRDSSRSTKKKVMDKIRTLNEKSEERVMSLLNKKQQKLYKKIIEEQKDKMKEGRKKFRPRN